VGNTASATALSVLVLDAPVDVAAAPLWGLGASLALIGVVLTSLRAGRPDRA